MFTEITTWIASVAGMTIGGKLVYGHRLQNSDDRCVLISESAGGSTVPELPDRADVLIQAISRARKYKEAREDIWIVYRALHGRAGINMARIDGSGPDYLANTIDALAIPQYLGPDEEGRHEFSVNFIFRMQEGSCTEPGP